MPAAGSAGADTTGSALLFPLPLDFFASLRTSVLGLLLLSVGLDELSLRFPFPDRLTGDAEGDLES
jgi:hypothetical protein